MIKKILKTVLGRSLWIFLNIKKVIRSTKYEKTSLKNSRILIVSCEGIGNAILSIPFIFNLKTKSQVNEVDVLTLSQTHRILFEKTLCCDEVLIYDNQWFHQVRQLMKLRQRHYDFCFIAFPTLSLPKLLIPLFIGSQLNVCHNYETINPYFVYLKDIFQTLVEIENDLHDVEQHLNLLKNFSVEIDIFDQYPPFHLSSSARAFANAFFQRNRLVGNQYRIAMHAGSTRGTFYKTWPIHHFIRLAELLKQNCNTNIIFIIGPQESDTKKMIDEQNYSILESENIENTAAVLAKCDYFISNDSGIMHLASLVRIPIVTIWGGTNHQRNGARALDVMNIINPISCRPCVHFLPNITCEQSFCECIEGISVETVANTVFQKIQNDYNRKQVQLPSQ